jgi:protein tyrosine phosphatase (PTP) superfamily phosphohydrolase (DUF442 family)
MTPRWTTGLTLGCALLISGCEHCCKKKSACPAPGCPGPGCPAPGIGGPQTLAPQNIPLDAPPRTQYRPPEVLLPTPTAPPATPPATSNYAPPTKPRVVLGEPDFDDQKPAAAIDEGKPPAKAPSLMPPSTDAVDPLPISIAGFAQVKDQVTTGLRPNLLDGFDWLKSKNYKSVLFLKNSKDDDSSDRKQVEQRNLQYRGLVVTPETIGQTTDEFIRQVNEAGNRPIFVYDLDGKRAGVMWYLYFRLSDRLGDQEARQRANRFGLKNSADAEQTQLWTAAQKLLSQRLPGF